jgi:hypothetical protein
LDYLAQCVSRVGGYHARINLHPRAEKRGRNLFQPGVHIPYLLAAGGSDGGGEGCFGNGDRCMFGPKKLKSAVQEMRNLLPGLQSKDDTTQDIGRLERSGNE